MQDLGPARDDLVEQTGAAGHGIVEHGVDGGLTGGADDEELQVFDLHLEDVGGALADGFHHAERLAAVGAAEEGEGVGDDVGVEADVFDRLATAFAVAGGEVSEGGVAGEGRRAAPPDPRRQGAEMTAAFWNEQAERYAAKPVADRSALDAAFADAMDKVALAYPDDDFILALAAEANMDTQPWDYWQADGRTPKGRAARTISLIETVLARNPDYQPAIHLYIHMTEATDNPYRAVAYADKLAKLSPSLGHLIHMPSHTYARVGRFKDSIDTNINAVASDETFLANSDPSPLYQYGYYVHNVHFVMTSAQMAGDKDTALAMAKKLDAKLPAEMAVAVPFAQPIKVAPYFAMVQFAAPEEILALEAPGEETPFMQAAWHYARGEAFAMMGDAEKARGEAEAISQIRATADFSGLVDNLVPAPDVLKIEQLTVTARAAALDGDLSTAIAAMEEAVATQEGLNYTEPPYWYYPAKQTLAAMVLRSGDAERAEQLFIETLAELPNNGWSYVGLAEAYKAQGDKNARKYAEGLMKSAWIGKEKPALERL